MVKYVNEEGSERQSRIDTRLDDLDKTIESCYDSLNSLETRLRPILDDSLQAVKPADDSPSPPTGSHLAGRLQSMKEKIRRLELQITEVKGRIDL